MKQIVPLLAWRYLLTAHQEKNVSIMAKICFWGILIATFSLALVLFIMNGFEYVTHEKLRGIHAHITIKAYGDQLNVAQITKVLNKEFPEIEAISPTTLRQVIITSPACDSLTNVVVLKGVDPDAEARLSTIERKIKRNISDNKTLPELLSKGQILIGDALARHLEVSPGDPVQLLFTQDQTTQNYKLYFEQHPVIVSGTFITGIDEFDTGLIFCSLSLLEKLWPDCGVTQLNLKLKNKADEETMTCALRKRLGIEVSSWKELYPALVSALKLEKYAMFFILMLITLVACTNIISLEFMHIMQKRGDIAILKAMGMTSANLQAIFLIIGTSISLLAAVVGLFFAGCTALFLQNYPFIELPDAYYVTHLPAKMEWHLFSIVFCVVILVSFIATWIPTRKIRTISIASILRSEA